MSKTEMGESLFQILNKEEKQLTLSYFMKLEMPLESNLFTCYQEA